LITFETLLASHDQCYGSRSGLDLDPDPGGQKLPTKMEKINKIHFLKCWMFSFEG